MRSSQKDDTKGAFKDILEFGVALGNAQSLRLLALGMLAVETRSPALPGYHQGYVQ